MRILVSEIPAIDDIKLPGIDVVVVATILSGPLGVVETTPDEIGDGDTSGKEFESVEETAAVLEAD